MRFALLAATLFALLSPLALNAQEENYNGIVVFTKVLKTAEWSNFKYKETLDLAKKGDIKAIKSFLEFSSVVDGTESLQHATTCLELIPFTTDEKMGVAIYSLKPKLKKALLPRFTLATGRTKKETLQKPLLEWAPLTWKGLNGEVVACSSCANQDGITPSKPGMQKPGMIQAPQATDAEPGGGKQ